MSAYYFNNARILELSIKIHAFIIIGIRRWQEYVELGDDLELDSQLRRTSRNLEDENVPGDVLPLNEGVLTRNLGLDVVVVVTKVTK